MNTNPVICPSCQHEIGPRYILLPRTDRMPPHDFLIKTWRGRFLRARVVATEQNRFSNETGAEQWNFKISFAEAVDESGDVKKDAHDRHVIFPGGVHSIRIDALTKGDSGKPSPSLTAFLGDRVLLLAEQAEDAMEVRDLAEESFVTGEVPSAKALAERAAALDARQAAITDREKALGITPPDA